MSMEDRDGWIWMDGQHVPWREARIHVLSSTFQTGAGVFEGVRAYAGELGTAIFRLRDHTDRLFNSAKILGMAIPYSKEQVDAAHIQVVQANGLEECYLRPVVYYDGKTLGVAALGNDVHLAIATWEWEAYLGAKAGQAGISVKTSSFSRHHVNAAMAKAKANGHYVNSMMAALEARQQGFDEALLLDTSGYVAECSTSNIFMIENDVLTTPERTAILAGITRDTVSLLAREKGLTVVERRITRDELYCADELFITGTAAELTPVVELDGRQIGNGRPGEITVSLRQAYFDTVTGRDPNKHHWLTVVDPPPARAVG